MAIHMEDRIAFLKQRQLFKSFGEDDLEKVANRMEEYVLPANQLLFAHGDRGRVFYIIYEGKVRIWRKEQGKEVELAVMESGDMFGEEALLFNRPRSASVTAVEDTHFLTIERPDFTWMLRIYPETKLNLHAVAESYQQARKLRFTWLQNEEMIHLIARRHPAVLGIDLFKPVAAFILAIILLLLAPLIPGLTTIFRMAGVFFGVVGLLWSIWEYIDWRNDYFIITNQRVVWLEEVILQSASRLEAPMSAIQSVNVETGQMGRIFGFGNVFVRTFTGTGSLKLDGVDNPNRFRDLIEELLIRVRAKSEETETDKMRQAIRQSLGLEAAPVKEVINLPEPTEEPKRGFSFLKTREVVGDSITYHKHWVVLLSKTWHALLGLGGMLFLTAYLASQDMMIGDVRLDLVTVYCFLTISCLGLGGFILYQYLDWKNDIYKLARETIIDSERKPLGREVTKSAPIKNILSLEHSREGILRLLLNFGDVRIVVADTTFNFFDVHDPARVQQDIFYRQEQLKLKAVEDEANQERMQMTEWLKAYHEVMHSPDFDEYEDYEEEEEEFEGE